MCAVIMALCKRPSILLLDEPLAALDPSTRREVLGSILEYVQEAAATVIISSHVITDLERTCDRVLLLDQFGMVIDDSIDNVLATHSWLDLNSHPKHISRAKSWWMVVRDAWCSLIPTQLDTNQPRLGWRRSSWLIFRLNLESGKRKCKNDGRDNTSTIGWSGKDVPVVDHLESVSGSVDNGSNHP